MNDELPEVASANWVARDLAMAVVKWLASDGDEDLFDAMKAKADKWEGLIVDAES